MNFNRKVVECYKEQHWHTYWQAKFECGHWGLAPNRGPRRACAKTAKCDACQRGELKPAEKA